MADESWTESGELPAGVVLALCAIDQDAVDAAQLREFVKRVKEPSEEERSRGLLRSNGHEAGILAGLVAMAGLGAMVTLSTAAGLAVFGGLGAAALATPAVSRALQRRRRARVDPTAAFELVVSSESFQVRRAGEVVESTPIDAIDGFTGGVRLHLRQRDGSSRRLGLTLASREHAALAARLTELCARARAARGGYR